MKKLNFFRLMYLISGCIILLYSCSRDEVPLAPVENDPYFITEDYAKNLALLLGNGRSVKSNGPDKTVKNISLRTGTEQKALYYMVSFEDSGYFVISADKRATPVLAFSDRGYLDKETIEKNPELKFLMSTYDEYIEEIRIRNIVDSSNIYSWDPASLEKSFSTITKVEGEGNIEFDCRDRWVEGYNNPRISTEWGQGNGYNYYCAYGVCSDNLYLNFKYPAGCAPVAIAQLVKYHQYPYNYDYSSMPRRIDTRVQELADYQQVARLIRDIGLAGRASYNCAGTSMSLEDCKYVLKNTLGYTSVTTLNYSYNNAVSALQDGPALVYGYNSSTNSAHLWVCDGSAYHDLCIHYTDDECLQKGYTTTYYLHMVFGYGEDLALTASNHYTNSGWFSKGRIADGTSIKGFNANMKIMHVKK